MLRGKEKANTVLELKTREYFVLTQTDLLRDTGWRNITPPSSGCIKPGTDNESEEVDALMKYSDQSVSCDNSLNGVRSQMYFRRIKLVPFAAPSGYC